MVPEPTKTPDHMAYRLRIHRPIPVTISTTVGDVLHNLRSALDSLAFEIARRGLDRPMTPEEESACAFPVFETPRKFDLFFVSSRNSRSKIRSQLYGVQARAAFRSAQPFRTVEDAASVGVELSHEQQYRSDLLHRLAHLSNLDKHRRLNLVAWWPDLVYWSSNGPTSRRWFGGDGTFTDGSVLGYMVGTDTDVSPQVFHDFNLVLTDDPLLDEGNLNSNSEDLVVLLRRCHEHVVWVFDCVFDIMSRDVTEFGS